MISVTNLSKHYGTIHAVKHISFQVKENAFFALLGPNGAGKSTTIEMLATLLQKDEGDVIINGHTLDQDDDAIRRSIGVVFQYTTLDPLLTVYENLNIRRAFYNMDKPTFETTIKYLDSLIHFNSFLHQPFNTLSGGQKRKADIARALLHNPTLLMLDEPTTGLDPKSRKDIWNLILTLKDQNNMTILLTTHYMEEVLDADHVIILHNGTIKAEDSADNLRKNYADDTLKIFPKAGLIKALKKDNIPYHQKAALIHIPLKNPFEGINLVKQYEAYIASFEIVKANMDDVFLNITGDALEGGETT
ncbi:MAG: ABC transporter ATP-binding protein [Bacillota bacterium]